MSELAARIEEHLDRNYYFRRERRYSGIWGRFNAWIDASDAEELEKQISREHYWEPDLLASDPNSFDAWYAQILAEHEADNFPLRLMRAISAKGLDPVSVYKKARIDRRLFSKIKSNNCYLPGKRTVLALAIGIGLDLEETTELLHHAGYHLSDRILFDVIVGYFLTNGVYDMDKINAVLVKYRLEPF